MVYRPFSKAIQASPEDQPILVICHPASHSDTCVFAWQEFYPTILVTWITDDMN